MAERILHSPAGEIRVRGSRDGIVFSLPEDLDSDSIIQQVRKSLESSGDFFNGARVVIDCGERLPDARELERIEAILDEFGASIRGVNAASFDDRMTLRSMGRKPLRIVAGREPQRAAKPERSAERRALYIRRTLRSGTSIVSDGDLVVMGDVNAGAEVTAVGDVVVWGVLRGTVHAGSGGADDVMICALHLEPTQLRIGSLLARPADDEDFMAREPQRAYVDGSTIVVEPWRGMDRRVR